MADDLADDCSTAVVPRLDHFSFRDYDNIYEPSDDTFLFLDALKSELALLRSLQPHLCVELGPGSGTLLTYLSQHLAPASPTVFLGVDINASAARATVRTAAANGAGARLEAVQMDLLSGIAAHKRGTVDILLFNPPYVPTPSEEVGGTGIEAAWAGGEDGREVIDRVLPLVPEFLSPGGVFYLLVVRENKPEEIMATMRERWGFECTTIISRQARNERLSVLKICRIAQTESG